MSVHRSTSLSTGIKSSKGSIQILWFFNSASRDGRNTTEIASRIAQAKESFQRMKSIEEPFLNSHKKKSPEMLY